jgi:hypothetical protein
MEFESRAARKSCGVACKKHKGSILSQCEFKVSVNHSPMAHGCATRPSHSSLSFSALMTNLKNAKFSYDIMKEKHYLRPDLSNTPFPFRPFHLLFSSEVV